MSRFASLVTGVALTAVTLATPAIARAEPVRLLVAVGQKLGLPAERPLKYADQDASRVRDVLVGLGGVRPEHAFVITGASRAQLFDTIERAKAKAREHKADEVTLVFYFSGHGDREALHLGDDRVALSELTTKLGEVPAALRIAVTDACRTTREKGFVADEPFAISATTSMQATGQVWLHASSDGEAAQESDELQGAIFTHTWLNGLRGAADSNGDARVTLDESFAFAHSQTLIRSAKSSGVLQKPEAVVALRELSPVVMTQTAPKLAKLSLPQATDAHFLVYAAGAKSVLSEVWGSPTRRIALAVPPGRYVVLRRLAGTGASAQIALGEGEQRELGDGDFRATALDAVARKGAGYDGVVEPDAPAAHPAHARPHELALGYDVGGDTRTGLLHGPRAGYTIAWTHLALTVGGGGTFAGRDLAQQEERLATAYGRVAVEARLPLGATLLRAGGGARVGWLWQTLSPATGVGGAGGGGGGGGAPGAGGVVAPSTGAATSTTTGAASTTNGAFVVGPEVFLGVRRSLGDAFFAEVAVTGALLALREEDRTRAVPTLSGALGLGTRF